MHHLTPNSFIHISMFVYLCEAFLGIEPHFELFRFLFHLKPQQNRFVLDVVGGAGLQLRQRKDRVYIPYNLSNKVIEWKPKWFYVENQSRRYSKEEILDDIVFSRVQRLLKNVKKILFVPGTFSAANPPKQVLDKSSRYVEIEHFIIVKI